MSFFSSVKQLPEDPILHLPILFKADSHRNKVNLGIGVYKDPDGKTSVLSCVRKAEKIIEAQQLDKEYSPIAGNPDFLKASLKVVFGHVPENVFPVQTVGGTGALRLGSEFLVRNGFADIYVSEPSWANHQLIFKQSGMHHHTYEYYNVQSHVLEFSKMCETIKKMPQRSVILLQACCHNPTGADLTPEQWKQLSELIKTQRIIPFFDLAYQGLGQDVEKDVFAVRYFMEQGHEMLVAVSYAKNLGLYGERVGMLATFINEESAKKSVASQLKQIARSIYSNPPIHGARIAATVMESPVLMEEWQQELRLMCARIQEIRHAFVISLSNCGLDFSFMSQQQGMFSLLGLNLDQVQLLRQKHGIYMTDNSRINLAGLNRDNIDFVAEAIAAVLKE